MCVCVCVYAFLLSYKNFLARKFFSPDFYKGLTV